MGQVLVRNLDDRVIESLRAKAELKGCSLEQELRDVLTKAASLTPEEKIALFRKLRAMTSPLRRCRCAPVLPCLARSRRRVGRPALQLVDASVALRWCFQLKGSDRAAIIDPIDRSVIRPIWSMAEITNAARKFVLFDRLSPVESAQAAARMSLKHSKSWCQRAS